MPAPLFLYLWVRLQAAAHPSHDHSTEIFQKNYFCRYKNLLLFRKLIYNKKIFSR